jgi:hypothetical protein
MLKKLLATTVALGLLACGGVIVLEAAGVLFQPVPADSEQHADAFLARLEADLNTPDLPTEPVEIASQVPQERPWQEAEAVAAVDATEARHMMAYVLQDPPPRREPEPQQREPEAEQLHVVAANDMQDHLIEAARQSGGHRSSLKGAVPEPGRDAGESAAPVRVAATMPPAGRLGGDCTGTCAAKPIAVRPGPPLAQRPTKPFQARYARTGTAQGRSFGCPVLDWLDSIL